MSKNDKTGTAGEVEEGATPTTRALNKVNAIGKAFETIGETAQASAARNMAKAIADLKGERLKVFEGALARRRGASFNKGDKVKVAAQFTDLYGKDVLEVVDTITVGGDGNGRGGRAWLKTKNAKGVSVNAPVACFEAA